MRKYLLPAMLVYALIWVLAGYFTSLGPLVYQLALSHYREMGFRADRIWLNNLLAASIFTFGGWLLSLPVLAGLAVNMLLMGAALKVSVQGGRLAYFFAAILPHGVIELPVIFYAGYLGFQITLGLLRLVPSEHGYYRALLTRFVVVVPALLALASVIEVFVTPRFAALFL